ncbi:MAG: hypothetical protein FWG98_04280 [Candidatus Cloacimonetes bacterium]|nr:hypothetical protein [Candidatus Cloacimonadota bacterium]
MNNTMKALYLYEIYALIKPFSELGTKEKRDFQMFHSENEENARVYYAKLGSLLDLVNDSPEQINLLGSTLNHFEDIESTILSGKNRTYEMHEIFQIKHFIYYYHILCNQLSNKGLIGSTENISELSPSLFTMRNFGDLFSLLDFDGQNSPTFYLSNNYSEQFNNLKEELRKTQAYFKNIWDAYLSKIIDELELSKLEETIAVSRANQALINKLLESKYFYISDENFANLTLKIKKEEEIHFLEDKINQINQELEKEAQKIRFMLTEKILMNKNDLLSALREIGFFDLLLAKADFGRIYGCVIPDIKSKAEENNEDENKIFEGIKTYNIFLQNELNKLKIDYQKIDINLHKKVNIITGSNMGGKTTILKTIGQISMMAKLGLPIPAEKISIKLFDKVFFCGPASSEDRADLSSFGIEVFTLQNVIKSKGFNLFLLDEFGRGTNPTEGQALFHSVMHYFSLMTDITIVSATHYNLPKNLSQCTHFQMIGLQDGFVDELKTNDNLDLTDKLKIIKKYMNYQPVEVNEHQEIPKSALHIAELLGLENDIIEMAIKEIKTL